MKRLIAVICFTAILLFLQFFLYAAKNSPDPGNALESLIFPDEIVSSVEIPSNLTFAGEPVPLDMFYVRESLDRELSVNVYWQSSTLLMIKRAYRWFPVIEPILKKYKVPPDFKYMALVESGFQNVVSPAGAAGFWQFIEKTALTYGLEVRDDVDERYNLEKATEAACKFLKDSYRQYGNWTLAAASFNAGVEGINKPIAAQHAESFYDLYLNRETSRYIYRILAMKTIFSNPLRYGFKVTKGELYPSIPTREMKVDSAIVSLVDFAGRNGTSYMIMKELNPWLVRDYLKNDDHRPYYIKFPKEGFTSYNKLREQVPDSNMVLQDTL